MNSYSKPMIYQAKLRVKQKLANKLKKEVYALKTMRYENIIENKNICFSEDTDLVRLAGLFDYISMT